MNTKSILSILLILSSLTGCTNSPEAIIHKVVNHYFELHNNFSTEKDVWGPYGLDLTFEAMLFYELHTGQDQYTKKVLDIMKLRNLELSDTVSYRSQPFCSYNYALYRATGNEAYVNPYVSETVRMMKEVKRTSEGAVMLRTRSEPDDGHGAQAIIYGMLAEIILTESLN